jgi:hypothetical protein
MSDQEIREALNQHWIASDTGRNCGQRCFAIFSFKQRVPLTPADARNS